MNRYWQDLERTIPAIHDGDPVASAEIDGEPFFQPILEKRPTLRGAHLVYDGVDDCMHHANGFLTIDGEYHFPIEPQFENNIGD